MKLCVIRPVTGPVTETAGAASAALSPLLRPDTELEFAGLERGFPSVETDTHVTFNAPEVLWAARDACRRGCDGVFVNCFDEPGVAACREVLPIPVLGAYQPAMTMAQLLSERYAVVTTDQAGLLSEERKARTWRFSPAAIRSVDMGVLDLCADQEHLLRRLEEACLILWRTERISAVVLGCTGMFPVVPRLQQRLRAAACPLTVVEPFLTGVCQLETLVRLGFSNAAPDAAVAMEHLNWYERI